MLVIVVTAAMQLLVASEPQRAGMLRDGQAALVYLSNWQFIADARDYFTADGTDTSPFLHYWSLSIEEQFYVVLPLLLLLLLRLRRHAVVVLLLLAARGRRLRGAPGLVRAAATRRTPTTPPRPGSTSSPPACCWRWSPGSYDPGARSACRPPSSASSGIVVVGSGAVDVTPSTRGLLATAVSVAAIAGLYAAPSGPAARLLALPLPRYLGQISYGTYLWHWPLILVTRDVFDVRPLVIVGHRRHRWRPDWRRSPTRCSSGRSGGRRCSTPSAGRSSAPD